MKTLIRRNTFETNSSSVHSITVSTVDFIDEEWLNQFKEPGNTMIWHGGEFGWEHHLYRTHESFMEYAYETLLSFFVQRLRDIYMNDGKHTNDYSDSNSFYHCASIDAQKYLKEFIIHECEHAGIPACNIKICNDNEYVDNQGYIDHDSMHPSELGEFANWLHQPGNLIKFIAGYDTILETWNDNECDCAFPTYEIPISTITFMKGN